ncbi:MAG: hypothetical protein IT452_21800 [Planctomycetia bacterium]|nr:hypothetical protein [Planctomycetia bacterium]
MAEVIARREFHKGEVRLANWHLQELRAAIEARGWRITELPGDDYRYTARWRLRRGNDRRVPVIAFEGLDDMVTLPIEKAYGVVGEGLPASLYFRRRGKSGSAARSRWKRELAAFVAALDAAAES